MTTTNSSGEYWEDFSADLDIVSTHLNTIGVTYHTPGGGHFIDAIKVYRP